MKGQKISLLQNTIFTWFLLWLIFVNKRKKNAEMKNPFSLANFSFFAFVVSPRSIFGSVRALFDLSLSHF